MTGTLRASDAGVEPRAGVGRLASVIVSWRTPTAKGGPAGTSGGAGAIDVPGVEAADAAEATIGREVPCAVDPSDGTTAMLTTTSMTTTARPVVRNLWMGRANVSGSEDSGQGAWAGGRNWARRRQVTRV